MGLQSIFLSPLLSADADPFKSIGAVAGRRAGPIRYTLIPLDNAL